MFNFSRNLEKIGWLNYKICLIFYSTSIDFVFIVE